MKFHEDYNKLLERIKEFKRSNKEVDMTLEELRRKLNFTQLEMSLVIGCSESSYWHWEHLMQLPHAKHQRTIDDLFGIKGMYSNINQKKKEEEQDETEGD